MIVYTKAKRAPEVYDFLFRFIHDRISVAPSRKQKVAAKFEFHENWNKFEVSAKRNKSSRLLELAANLTTQSHFLFLQFSRTSYR